MKVSKVASTTDYPLVVYTNSCTDFKAIILLLHGYSEEGQTIYKRLNDHLPQDHLVVAVDGLFPLVDRFPLDTKPTDKKLLRGYAWYFYDAVHDKYLIDYDVAASALNSLLTTLNPQQKEITIIGYSQGGYLAPFIAAKNKNASYVIGVNCSYRHDLFPQNFWDRNIRVDAIQAEDDPIIDIESSKERHSHLNGNFDLIPNENHRLSKNLCKIIGRYVHTYSEHCSKV
jgi:predicted esterase